MNPNKLKVGITQGDINSTTYEIMTKTFQESLITDTYIPVIYGSPKVAAYYRKALNITTFSFNTVASASEMQDHKSNIVNVLDDDVKVELGKSTQVAGESALISIEKACADIEAGITNALIVNPINIKNTAEFNLTDQFDFVKKRTNTSNSITIWVNDALKVCSLTGSMSLLDAAKKVTASNILTTLRTLNQSLITDFGIDKPKIAVLGLNPNLSNATELTREEKNEIAPAIESANNENILAMGPYDAETVFGTDLFTKFDAVLAMYYDQGMVPFRALSYDDGVSYMAGASFICVEPMQEVDYENAGLDKANPCAFQKALQLVCKIGRCRNMHAELTANVLKTHTISE